MTVKIDGEKKNGEVGEDGSVFGPDLFVDAVCSGPISVEPSNTCARALVWRVIYLRLNSSLGCQVLHLVHYGFLVYSISVSMLLDSIYYFASVL